MNLSKEQIYKMISGVYQKNADKAVIRKVRKICEPLLNEYTFVFIDDDFKIHATAKGFEMFSFLDVNIRRPSKTGDYPTFVWRKKSFSSFLIEIQYTVTRIIHNRTIREKPSYDFTRLSDEINEHIKNVALISETKYVKPLKAEESTADEILFIFDKLSSTLCYRYNHPVVPEIIAVDCLNVDRKIILPVHYCKFCKKYCIGRITLEIFEKNYGKLIIEKRMLDDYGGFQNFRSESKLHSLGYNVINGEMTESERHKLLVYLLESRKISYLEICSTIEGNIQLFKDSYRHSLAVKKWKEDLKFIGKYMIRAKENEK